MNTRIKRYAKLREQIDQEIQMIKFKNENNQKVLFYKEKLNKIDKKVFDQINQEIQIDFPNFSSLLQVKQTDENNDLNKDKQDINKWLEVINDIWKDEQKTPQTLEEYLPSLSSERFVLQKLATWKIKKQQNKKYFMRMIKLKEKIEQNTPKTAIKTMPHAKLLEVTNKVNAQILHYDQKLDVLIERKKRQTKWIFWVNLFFFCALFICLMLVLTN